MQNKQNAWLKISKYFGLIYAEISQKFLDNTPELLFFEEQIFAYKIH